MLHGTILVRDIPEMGRATLAVRYGGRLRGSWCAGRCACFEGALAPRSAPTHGANRGTDLVRRRTCSGGYSRGDAPTGAAPEPHRDDRATTGPARPGPSDRPPAGAGRPPDGAGAADRDVQSG